jgi:transposase
MPHTLTSSQLEQLIRSNAAASLSADARERLGWIAIFVQQGKSIGDTCADLHISRSTFHRWLERFNPEDLTSLEEKSHMPMCPRSPIVPDAALTLIRAYRHTHPLMGKERIQELLEQEHQLTLSASTIGRVIERECLYFAATPLHWKKRMDMEKKHTSVDAVSITEKETEEERGMVPTSNHECMEGCVKQAKKLFWKRVIVRSSVVINIAIITLFLATISMESKKATAQLSNTQTSETTTLSDIDHP